MLITIIGKTGSGKSHFAKKRIATHYEYAIYVNPKFEVVNGYMGLWNFKYDVQEFLRYKRIVIRDGKDIFNFILEIRKYLPLQVKLLIVLDELHIYDNDELQHLATTSRSLNVDTVVIVQKLSKISTIWVTECEKLLIFRINNEHLNILRGSIYQYDIDVQKVKEFWNKYKYGFVVYDYDRWIYVKNL